MSWSALAAGLGPLLIVRALGRPAGTVLSLAVMLTGLATAFAWRYGFGLADDVFEAFPGMLAGALVYLVFRPRGSAAAKDAD
jgi:sodium/proline symporter